MKRRFIVFPKSHECANYPDDYLPIIAAAEIDTSFPVSQITVSYICNPLLQGAIAF
ncbi:MAG: hypothetical protein ACM3VS_06605 [Candidatus Dadabacteria bacterium]